MIPLTVTTLLLSFGKNELFGKFAEKGKQSVTVTSGCWNYSLLGINARVMTHFINAILTGFLKAISTLKRIGRKLFSLQK